ncbi:MAG: ABC transporter transmembrane domain-containing protein, partial [Defluviitaleaceae bacterium]|nr:ABC transporter transmembrane domain-containing protein [Defluviitaleaceae bacterium]
MHAIKWGLPYVSKYKWRLIFGLFVNTINGFLMLIGPILAGLIVHNVIEGGQRELLSRYLAIMIVITVYRSVSRYLFVLLYEDTSQKILFNLRRDVYKKLHMQSFAWFDKNRVGDIMSRMTGDLEAIRHFIAFVSYMVIEHILLYISAVVVMFTISVPLTLSMLVTTPILIWAALKQSAGVRPAFKNVREQFANLNSMCGENISGNRVVKAFTKESRETEKFTEVNRAFFDANLDAAKVRVKYFPVMETCAALLPWFLLLVGGLLAIFGQLEIWELVAFGGYLWMIDAPTRIFTWAVNDIQNAAASLEKVHEMMRHPIMVKSPDSNKLHEANDLRETCNIHETNNFSAREKIGEKNDEKVFSSKREKNSRADEIDVASQAVSSSKREKISRSVAVEFRDVTFSYAPYETNEIVLKNISFAVEKGQTVGIVGATGAGKTTLINLIARFYDTCKGEVFVRGVNVKDYNLQHLRRGISYANQDVFLFSDTIEGNIAFGVPDAPMCNIYTAAAVADAENFINEMP